VTVGYPDAKDELDILRRTTEQNVPEVQSVMTAGEILRLQGLVRATRPDQPEAPEFIKQNLRWGAGPRAGQYLVLGAKARAVIKGRFHVSIEDIQRAARPVLRHRILTNYAAQAEGIRPDDIIDRLLQAVPVHPSKAMNDGGLPEVVGPSGR